jgi:hypothetical protein
MIILFNNIDHIEVPPLGARPDKLLNAAKLEFYEQ